MAGGGLSCCSKTRLQMLCPWPSNTKCQKKLCAQRCLSPSWPGYHPGCHRRETSAWSWCFTDDGPSNRLARAMSSTSDQLRLVSPRKSTESQSLKCTIPGNLDVAQIALCRIRFCRVLNQFQPIAFRGFGQSFRTHETLPTTGPELRGKVSPETAIGLRHSRKRRKCQQYVREPGMPCVRKGLDGGGRSHPRTGLCSKFPGNRENYRESLKNVTLLGNPPTGNPRNCRCLVSISLSFETGNFRYVIREQISIRRECRGFRVIVHQDSE